MHKSSLPKSLPLTFVFFWIFSSVPRVWYEIQEGPFKDGVLLSLKTFLVGFLQDGVLVVPLLLAFWFSQPLWSRLSANVRRSVQRTTALVMAILIAFLMANVEFFRYFGSNVTISHFSFITETDIMTPSFATVFPWPKLVGTLILVPAAFLFLCAQVPSFRFDRYFLKRRALAVLAALLVVCATVPRFSRQSDILKQNLSDNFILNFLGYLIKGDDVRGESSEPIEKILQPGPLKKDGVNAMEWFPIDPRYPLARATAHHLCAMDRWNKLECDKDNDGDGVALKNDCNDNDPNIHPGAEDIPGNGIDEDCSGMDAAPPNVIFIHWEGARAVNVGSIGYAEPATPNFDRLAKKGLLFRNAYANGTQTRWSLTSVYNSILPRLSTKWIFRHNPELELLAFPKMLRDAGYHTLYFHGGDINFGDLRRRFSGWFETMIDRNNPAMAAYTPVGWGLTDKDLFDFTFRALKERKDPRPFYASIATLSLHHPFELPDKKFEIKDHRKPENRVPNILRYSDEQLGNFIDRVLADVQLKNTIIVVAADHGLNAHAPHATGAQSTLWEDLVWVPILLVGDKWNARPGKNDEIRQLADIGPTILDRLGIERPNHFIGHSLLRRFGPDQEAKAFFGNANGGISAGVRVGPYKYFISFKNQTENLYDLSVDQQERRNLARDPSKKDLLEKLRAMVTNVAVQNTRLIQENRFWNSAFDLRDGR